MTKGNTKMRTAAQLRMKLHRVGVKTYRNTQTQASFIKTSDLKKVLSRYDIDTKGDDELTEIFYRDHKIGEIYHETDPEYTPYRERIYDVVDEDDSAGSSDWASDAETMKEAVKDVVDIFSKDREIMDRYDDQIDDLEENDVVATLKLVAGGDEVKVIANKDAQFTTYVMDFYGPEGLNVKDLSKPFTEDEIKKAISILKITKELAYDSVDREWVRDIVLVVRGDEPWGI